jgi:16S rRNA (guanine527-N7)-methyltransferase
VARSPEFLLEARRLGLLGPGPLDVHIEHSKGFLDALARVWKLPDKTFDLDFDPGADGEGTNLLDLGSGGGVPGLVVAGLWPASRVAVLDSSHRRCELLSGWVEEAGWESRVTVLCGRAEELGRQPELRYGFDAVLARSFGRPSVTAECAAPFLRIDGLLAVSDPPAPEEASPDNLAKGAIRWPSGPLRELGLEPQLTITDPFHFTILRQRESCPERYPRRTGIPAKRPLF